ncbi:hypothetical protein PanWU01x14_349580 [Parasponia andersonii]|uniref:Uncharacterized protein n=1 Tax=Parasponia andersonii TaxID=3476 RepID=A0A2P5AB90_PARAD|nr:hypothetical protein PanWU01x14_349580 [Parasponia andersonii]
MELSADHFEERCTSSKVKCPLMAEHELRSGCIFTGVVFRMEWDLRSLFS